MRTQPQDVRCSSCGILLARVDDSGLMIRRGDLQATITGEVHASLVCYRSSCRRLNVVRTTTGAPPPRAAAT